MQYTKFPPDKSSSALDPTQNTINYINEANRALRYEMRGLVILAVAANQILHSLSIGTTISAIAAGGAVAAKLVHVYITGR